MSRRRPTKEEIQAAEGNTVPDVIAPDLKVLFCGINPGLYSGAVGYHFARPGNRFWPALYAAGFTERRLSPDEEDRLLEKGYGITNVVERATAGAADLSTEEILAGRRALEAKVDRYQPKYLAVLGLGVYRTAFDHPGAMPGLQPETIAGTPIWLLPNPSGLNAHYQVADLAELFHELRLAAEER